MPLDWKSGPLAAGLACYRNGEYFEAHEHWEDAWNKLADPEKSFVQGLIQVTVAMHHYQSANRRGALSLLQRALRRFERCPDRFAGIEVASLTAEVRAWLDVLESRAISMPAHPEIKVADC